jgi:hypothetical protein
MAGRPAGRRLESAELEHLRFLLEIRETSRSYKERLEDFVLKCLESGASTRGMSEQLGVPDRTIQSWKENAQQRRGE